MDYNKCTITKKDDIITIKDESGEPLLIARIKGNAEQTLYNFLYTRRECGASEEDLQIIVDKVREILGDTATENTWMESCNALAAEDIAKIEQIISDFEEIQKDNKDIDWMKEMHQRILSNIKKTDVFQVKRDFERCINWPSNDTTVKWRMFIRCLDDAAKAGRDYRK